MKAFLIYGTAPTESGGGYGIEAAIFYATDEERAKVLYSRSIENFNQCEYEIMEVLPGDKEEIAKKNILL
jgi:hypothetical protein